MGNRARVFVSQRMLKRVGDRYVSKFGLAPARKFGTIQFVLDWDDTRGSCDPNLGNKLLWKIREALRDFTPHDYLILVGDPVVMTQVGIIASEITGGKVKMLVWDKVRGEYDPVEFDINSQPLPTTMGELQ